MFNLNKEVYSEAPGNEKPDTGFSETMTAASTGEGSQFQSDDPKAVQFYQKVMQFLKDPKGTVRGYGYPDEQVVTDLWSKRDQVLSELLETVSIPGFLKEKAISLAVEKSESAESVIVALNQALTDFARE